MESIFRWRQVVCATNHGGERRFFSSMAGFPKYSRDETWFDVGFFTRSSTGHLATKTTTKNGETYRKVSERQT